jgi:cysteine desulfuration protein SufE
MRGLGDFRGAWGAAAIYWSEVTIAEKQRQLAAALGAWKTAQDRLGYIVGLGRKAPPLESEFKTEAFRVEGCLAKVWFVPEFASGRCRFRADSDSAIVKGIAVLLCEVYGDQPPEAIVHSSPVFLEELGVTQHLTPNRRNSLAKIWERIHGFARSHLA